MTLLLGNQLKILSLISIINRDNVPTKFETKFAHKLRTAVCGTVVAIQHKSNEMNVTSIITISD